MAMRVYDKVLKEALELSPEQQWALIANLVQALGAKPKKSLIEYFGRIAATGEDAQAQVDRLRAEWMQG